MSNNKLKNMIGNHELDDFVNNEELKEKLCKLQTSEEVLELLKNYNYNESKEVFEVELMDLLKEFVDEEELLKVSGGGADRKNFSKMITSLALAGTLCVPAQGVTGVQQKEKQKDMKRSYSVGLPPKEKVAVGVAGIVGVGVILEEILRRKVFAKKDKNCGEITEQEYTEMREHFMKIATRPQDCKTEDFERYTIDELKEYIFAELIKWFASMDKYYKISTESDRGKTYVPTVKNEVFRNAWNYNLPTLINIVHAHAALMLNGNILDKKMLDGYLAELRACTLKLEPKSEESIKTYGWQNGLKIDNGETKSTKLENCLDHKIYTDTLRPIFKSVVATLMRDWTNPVKEKSITNDSKWQSALSTKLRMYSIFGLLEINEKLQM